MTSAKMLQCKNDMWYFVHFFQRVFPLVVIVELTCSSRVDLSERVVVIGRSMTWMIPLAAGRSSWMTVYGLLGLSIRMNL